MDSTTSTLGDRPLAVSIAIATRTSHTRLNKSIIARLPLVVNAPDPSAYVTGMMHIAPIYLTFETLWKHLLDSASSDSTWLKVNADSNTTSDEAGPPSTSDAPETHVPERIRAILERLYLPELMRSNRLRADIRAMTGWSEQVVEEQLQERAKSGRLGEFTSHIRRSIEHRPHVLIAYSYILFMALFAGGRYMRATFESAGDEFWEQTPSKVKPSMMTCEHRDSLNEEPASQLSEIELQHAGGGHADHRLPLRFFHFATLEDGEDLKRTFKERLLEAEREGGLTHQEKHDIVQEAVCIFDNMELLVTQLDQVCAMDADAEAEDMSPLTKKMTMRARDSVFVHRARAARSSRISSDSDDSDSNTDETVLAGAKMDSSGSSKSSSAVSDTSGGIDSRTSMFDIRTIAPGHAHLSIRPDMIELCPAMKSMKFDRNLATPTRSTPGEEKPREIASASTFNFNWMLVAAVGVVAVGAIMTTRRGMIGV